MDKPEALLLAHWLERDGASCQRHVDAAAELRRLHDDNENTLKHFSDAVEAYKVMSAQRDALLEALRWIADRCPVHLSDHPLHNIHKEMSHDAGARARAAIKAVEGEKT